jgi:Late exocytosis, associated with Golgi transport/Calcium-dependent channel, 7TM region, putative phosphate/Cytosolic domain of 10TM putative phosphate transporter
MKIMQTSSQALNHVCLLIIVFFLKNLDAASNETLSPTPSPTTASLEESQNWDVLRTSLIIYLPSFVVVILIFCYARLKFPAVYNVRNTVESIKNPLAATPYGFFSWMWNVMYVSEADIFDTCGMDALCLLRITRMGTYLSCISIFCSIFLIPVYEYAQSASELTDEWVQTTTTSLPEASNSFTATVVGAYIIFGSTTYLITKEFQWFVVAREKFLSLRVARSYTVYVSGLPRAYRSNAALAQFFRRIFADDVVHSASVAMHLPKLTAAVYRQMTLEQNLERAKMLRSLDHGKEPMQTLLNPTKKDIVERVPAIPYYTQQLAKVHEDIYELKAIIEKRQELSNSGQYTSSFSQSKSQENGEVRQNSSKNGKLVSAASIAIGALSDLNDEGGKLGRQERDNRGSEIFVEPDDCEVNERDSDNFDSFFCARESLDGSNEENVEVESGDTSGQDVANTTPSICNGLQYAATVSEHVSEAGSRGITKVVSIIATAIGHGGSDEGKPLDAGFVTFTKLSAASFALQTVHSSVPFQMDVVESPSPEQVLWNNVGLTNRSVQPRRLFVFAITTLLCIFWTVPVALLVSLTEVKVLKEKLPFLDEWLEAAPWLEQVLSQISPLLLSFLNSVVVPMLMRQISAYEGVLGLSHLEASLFTKLAAFSVRFSHSPCCTPREVFLFSHLAIVASCSYFKHFSLLHWRVVLRRQFQKSTKLVMYFGILRKLYLRNQSILCN